LSRARVPEWAQSAFTLVVAVAAAALIWSLAAQNRALKAEIVDLYAELDALQETTALQVSLAEGDTIPDTPVVGLAGQTTTLSELVSRGGVIAFLTTTCPYCEEMLPVWADLAERYADRGVPFLGVMLDGAEPTGQYVAEHGIEWPLWALADPSGGNAPQVAIVPYTVLVLPGGAVGSVWAGVLEETEVAMVAAALEDELAESQQMLSGSSVRDPDCCTDPPIGTDAGDGQ